MKRLVLALVGLAQVASAEPDLRLHGIPPRLTMRPHVAVEPPPEPPIRLASLGIADENPGPPSRPPAPAPGPLAAKATAPTPPSTHDLASRVTLRIRAGAELDGAPASGDALRGGAQLPSGYSGYRPWVVGDAVVGARDLLLPSLGAYLLSSFQLDASDSLATRSALVEPSDANGQRIAIKAGYAEWGRDERSDQQHLWLRAGRQFRLDAGGLFAYFDGATLGWREHAWSVSTFGGQRVALYVDTPHGTTFGGTAAIDLGLLEIAPVKLAADAMALAVSGDLRQLIAFAATYESSKTWRLDARARIVDGGTGLGFGRAGARLKLSPSRSWLVIADLEQRSGGDLAYDLASPSAVDVVDIARKLGVGLASPIDATTLGARVDLRRGDREVLGFTRVEIPEGTPTSVAQRGWVEAGAAIAGTPALAAWTTAQYTFRQYFLDAVANEMGSSFSNTGGSGLTRLHELAVDATWRRQTRSGRRWRVSAGAFYRIYDLRTPYVIAEHDGRGGARGDLQYWLSRELHVDISAELAQSSPVLTRDLGPVSSVRGAVEARW